MKQKNVLFLGIALWVLAEGWLGIVHVLGLGLGLLLARWSQGRACQTSLTKQFHNKNERLQPRTGMPWNLYLVHTFGRFLYPAGR